MSRSVLKNEIPPRLSATIGISIRNSSLLHRRSGARNPTPMYAPGSSAQLISLRGALFLLTDGLFRIFLAGGSPTSPLMTRIPPMPISDS